MKDDSGLTKEEIAELDEIERRVLSGLKVKNEPFDVPMVDPEEDEFAFIKNLRREALMEAGEYDAIRVILECERLDREEYEKELAENKAAGLI